MSEQIKPDSNQFPKWMRWLAQDADGRWWGYEHEPHLAEVSWYENEVGLSVLLELSVKSNDWKESLQKIGD